jgi:hypothetical protein
VALGVEVAALAAGILAMRALSGASHDDLQVLLFYHYGHAFWFGTPPFHTLPVEYPPLSLALFSLSVLPPLQNPIMDVNVYTVWMAALTVAGYLLFRRFAGVARAPLAALAVLIAVGSVLLISYDLAPVLATLGALWAVERRRFTLAYTLLAVGILLKLYPVFLAPVVAIEQASVLAESLPGAAERRLLAALLDRRVWADVIRGLGICAGIVLVVLAGFWLLNGSGSLSAFGYAGQRPLEYESVPANLLWASHYLGVPVRLEYGFGAFNWVSPLDGPFKLLSAVFLVAGCIWVYWRQITGRLSFGHAFLACLCVVVATNKVLSPQYLLWLLPIVVALDCFDTVWLLICGLTLLEYPLIVPLRHHLAPGSYYTVVEFIVILRNALLILATLRLILGRPLLGIRLVAVGSHSEPMSADASLAPE